MEDNKVNENVTNVLPGSPSTTTNDDNNVNQNVTNVVTEISSTTTNDNSNADENVTNVLTGTPSPTTSDNKNVNQNVPNVPTGAPSTTTIDNSDVNVVTNVLTGTPSTTSDDNNENQNVSNVLAETSPTTTSDDNNVNQNVTNVPTGTPSPTTSDNKNVNQNVANVPTGTPSPSTSDNKNENQNVANVPTGTPSPTTGDNKNENQNVTNVPTGTTSTTTSDNKNDTQNVTNVLPGTSSTASTSKTIDKLELDLFESQNFAGDNFANGTTREVFDRRILIDRKNLVELFIGQFGIKWDTYGECTRCGKECRLRCIKCPWIFYCGKEHQLEDWPEHKKNCKNIDWGEDGRPRAGRDLAAGIEILEKSTIFVSPRYHTRTETRQMTEEDHAQSDGAFRPCFGCHLLIHPYFNTTLVCSVCKFPMHNKACEASPWHAAECQVLKKMFIQNWYDDIGYRNNIMIHLAVLRGVLLKNTKPSIWEQIMSLESDSLYLTSEELKKSIMYFIIDICQPESVVEEDVVKFLSIFMKNRLNCSMPCNQNKRLVSVICSGIMPFTLVNDRSANVQGGIKSYRMRMVFRTTKPVLKGELLTIGHGVS